MFSALSSIRSGRRCDQSQPKNKRGRTARSVLALHLKSVVNDLQKSKTHKYWTLIMSLFDAKQMLDDLRKLQKKKRKSSYKNKKSRLEKYKSEILELRENGGSIVEVQRFLRQKRIKVVHSTVSRFIKKYESKIG